MKTIYFDSVGGASGDMILACLLDLGADLEGIRKSIGKLCPDKFSIDSHSVSRNGFHGMRVDVDVRPRVHAGHGHHRKLGDIERLINAGELSASVKKRALAVFRRLAEAEALVHGVKPADIHFHEVGAMDSIIDIVGACIALEQLGVAFVALGPLPLGRGTIKCAHGILPSPAPATVELLKGFAVEQTDEPYELVTPTGAALLTTWKNIPRAPAGAVVVGSGCGFGRQTLRDRPNLLRAIMLESESNDDGNQTCLMLECNIDDANPELIGNLSGRLLAEGALDAFITAVQMKKGRPGALLTVLCSPEKKARMLDLIFRETTTFGVREQTAQRTVLPRRFVSVETRYGKVRLKIGSWKGEDITCAPEHEDCVLLAEKAGVPVRVVYEAALALAMKARNQG